MWGTPPWTSKRLREEGHRVSASLPESSHAQSLLLPVQVPCPLMSYIRIFIPCRPLSLVPPKPPNSQGICYSTRQKRKGSGHGLFKVAVRTLCGFLRWLQVWGATLLLSHERSTVLAVPCTLTQVSHTKSDWPCTVLVSSEAQCVAAKLLLSQCQLELLVSL